MQSPIVNAMAIGKDRPFIVLTTGLVNLNDEEELRFVVGHELGHILSGHAVYRTMLLILIQLSVRIAWMPIGYLGLRAIIWGLEEWFRKSEVSCDRAGLLAGQDVDAARRALMKLAGGPQLSELNPDAFREQAREYDAVPDLRDSILKLLQLQGNTHPFAVVRFAELDRWATDGVVRGDPVRRLPAPRHRPGRVSSPTRRATRPTPTVSRGAGRRTRWRASSAASRTPARGSRAGCSTASAEAATAVATGTTTTTRAAALGSASRGAGRWGSPPAPRFFACSASLVPLASVCTRGRGRAGWRARGLPGRRGGRLRVRIRGRAWSRASGWSGPSGPGSPWRRS